MSDPTATPPEQPQYSREPVGKMLRFEVFKRDKFTCIYCGRRAPAVVLNVDHLIAVSKGGTSDENNLVTACFDCNVGKGNRPLSEAPGQEKRLDEGRQERQARLEQLIEFQKFAANEALQHDRWLNSISDHWMRREDADPLEYRVSPKAERAIRHFLKLLPYSEIIDAVDVTFDKRRPMNDFDRFKYFCGVCWRKVRGDRLF